MPTGYTAAVADGKVTDFRTFALRCARGFGAAVMQRDNPMDELPKHREESGFYARTLREAEADAARLAAMSLDEAQVAMAAEIAEEEARIVEARGTTSETNSRYEAMLAQVLQWEPPSPDHIEFRDFMVTQLRLSIGTFTERYWREEDRPAAVGDWLAARRVKAAGRIEQYQKEVAEERERCRNANAWIDALYASLGEQVPA
jgi:hypothetical protein